MRKTIFTLSGLALIALGTLWVKNLNLSQGVKEAKVNAFKSNYPPTKTDRPQVSESGQYIAEQKETQTRNLQESDLRSGFPGRREVSRLYILEEEIGRTLHINL